ncbi:hypothetical protein D3C80_2108990 [compost metagenome]
MKGPLNVPERRLGVAKMVPHSKVSERAGQDDARADLETVVGTKPAVEAGKGIGDPASEDHSRVVK